MSILTYKVLFATVFWGLIILPIAESNASILIPAAPSQKADTTYAVQSVDMIPMFPGGATRLQDFLSKYYVPQEARDNHVAGIMYVQFVVSADGNLTDIKVLRDLKFGTSEEAIRLFQSSPKWTPGIKNGKPVRVTMTQPIRIGFPDAINRTEITIAAPVGKQSPQVTTVGDAAPINADVVQVQPHYPGGEMGLQKFLSGYKVPQEAINNKVSGILYVQFIVETDGSISDVKVLRDLKYGTAEEAIRLMKSSPKWIPGISNGRKVRVVFTQPIRISAN